MPKLKIDTSLFEPIEIEIDGKVYEARRLTRDVFKEIQALDEEISAGNIEAGYKLLEMLLGQEAVDVISGLDISIVNQICDFIVNRVATTGEAEKNGPKSGGKDSQ
jgi:hypothetical protein